MATNRSYLADLTEEDKEQLITEFKSCSTERLKELAKHLGYSNTKSLKDSMYRILGVSRERILHGVDLDIKGTVINIPEIKITPYKSTKRVGDPETQGLLLGDWHYGEITPTFNPEVADTRLDNLFTSSMRITELHRHMYPVNDLVVIALGDMVHGENPRQGARVGSVSKGAVDQVYDLAFPKLLGLLSSFRENFRTVRFYGVPGNHGRVSMEAPETSNWDLMLYKALSNASLPKGIEIHTPKDFCQIINIMGFDFFCHHGDSVRMTNGIPYFAQTRKTMSWYITFGGFAYSVSGHIHKDDFYRISAKTKQMTNGALPSDDPYALKVVGTSTIPCQTTFGVHANKGVSWYYSLILDDKALPDKKTITMES